MDYLIFLTGLFLLIAGAGCLFHFREDRRWSRWPLVTVALTAFGCKIWFEVLVFAFGWRSCTDPVQALFGAVFAGALLGFCLSSMPLGRRRRGGFIVAAVAAIALWVFCAGASNSHSLAFIIPLLAVAFDAARRIGKLGAASLPRQLLITLLLTVIVAICLLPNAVETSYDTRGEGYSSARVVLLCALAAATLCSIIFCSLLWLPLFQNTSEALPGGLARRRRIVTAVLLAAAVFTCLNGAWLTRWLGAQANQEEVTTLLSALKLGASNLDVDQIQQLKGVPEEIESAGFKELRDKIRLVKGALPGVHFTYLLGMRNQKLVFLVDAEDPTNEETFSPPGEPVFDYPEKWQNELAGQATFEGPDPDEWGVWFAGCVPILDSKGTVVALLGIDYPATTWLQPLAARRMAGMVVTLSVALLIASLFGAHVAAREAERTLLLSRARADRLALVAKRTDNAVVITDASGNIEWVNEGFTKISGYTLEDALGRPPGAFLQRRDSDSAERNLMRACIQAGKGFATEIVNYTKDGRAYIVHIECQPLVDGLGTLTGFMAIERDVTQARRSSKLLEAVAATNTTLLASQLGYTVWAQILSSLGTAAHADRCYLYRIHPHPVDGTPATTPVAEWNSGTSSPQLDNPDHQCFSFHENGYDRWLVELSAGRAICGLIGDFPASEQIFLLDQEIRSLVVVPIFTGTELTGFLGFDACREDRVWENWEISVLHTAVANIGLRQVVQNEAMALVLARDEARNAAIAADAANRAKSAFLATMSHEIRTPLNAVIGMASLLEASPFDTKQQDIAETIIHSSNFLLDLINDILDYSRIESGHMDLEVVPFILADICREAFNVVRPEAVKKSLELSSELAPQLPLQFQGDRARIRQILVNLLSNAAKFTAAGFIRLNVDGRQTPDGSWELVMKVEDSGIGIAPEALGRLFSPFVQEDSSTTRRFGGSGLGLAISKRLATAMGGDISVQSRPGEGSCFQLALALPPASDQAIIPAIEATDEFDGSRFANLQVLVAEDNLNNQKVIRLILQRLGIEPDCVADGRLAVAAAEAKDYDIIVLDVQMPVMDGLAASRGIRALQLAKRPLIVALTANAFQEDQDAVFAAGMDEYLTKPITLGRFRQLLAKIAKGFQHLPEPTRQAIPPAPLQAVPPLIDVCQLETFLDLGHAAYQEILAEFIREIPSCMTVIRELIEAGDGPALKGRFHSFRGGLACFGCVAMTSRIAGLEAQTGIAKEAAAPLVAELQDLWERSLAAIRSWERDHPEFKS